MGPITVVAPTASADGYGVSGEHLILAAVREHGADIALVGHDWADERYSDPDLLALKQPESCIAERGGPLVVYFLPYGMNRFRGWGPNLSQTMWESDKIPDIWARLLGEFADGVIVPSEHCAEVFRESVTVPVVAVPYGTDAAFFTPVEREPADKFTFLMSGLLHYRKGVEFALRALREEFTANEPVRLALKTRRGFLDAGCETPMLGDPRVVVLDCDFTREEMRQLYWEADCLLAPSRGEGSGLTPRDAMATGLPTILTNWGGLAEIADERYAYPVEVECLETAPLENSSYGRGVIGSGTTDIGNFARPSVVSLRAQMREVYEHREESAEVGAAAALWMRREWTWGQCAGQWLQAIEDLSKVAA